jgi:2-keto-4-pentenoate hydratase/2-oxohepta-3-ene-1,7-dioic acid hydratase in catechol pathway
MLPDFPASNLQSHNRIGPAIVTADEIGDPHNLDISLTLSG